MHGTTSNAVARKSIKRGLRSRSLGPGGLEGLSEGTGNRQKVNYAQPALLLDFVNVIWRLDSAAAAINLEAIDSVLASKAYS